MKAALLLLMAAGLVLGPGYWIYAKLYSGRLAQVLELRPDAAGGLVSGDFRLTGDMGPVGLILKAQGEFAPNMDEHRPPADAYRARVYRDGRLLREVALRLAAAHVSDSHPVFVERLLWLEAVTPGDYRLSLVPAGAPEIRLGKTRLEVRSRVLEPDGRVVAAGAAMVILGALAWFAA